MRVYQARMDKDYPKKGKSYGTVPESYMVFICLDDPLKKGIPVYSIEHVCIEDPTCEFDTLAHWKILYAPAFDQLEHGPLRDLLEYVSTGAANSDKMRILSEEVGVVNRDAEWRCGVRTFEEFAEQHAIEASEDAREEGRAEMQNELLAALMENAGMSESEARKALGLDAASAEVSG